VSTAPLHSTRPAALAGVFPVLPTPFDAEGRPDTASLRRLVRYLLACGVDGLTYPGVASEVAQLSSEERLTLTAIVIDEVAGRVPVIVGASSAQVGVAVAHARAAQVAGAQAVMVAVPADRPAVADQIAYFEAIAQAVPGLDLMLQNVPPPAGAGLEAAAVLQVLRAVTAIRYVKEETLPSGQRLTQVLTQAPASLAGVFGGAGGRYITDELRRGAAGTMPAIELAEVHVLLMRAHRAGDVREVRRLFTRMLPVLNVQAVFRWSLTKHVLRRRGLIATDLQRASGPRLDDLDRADVDAFVDDLRDLLLPDTELPA
jgi:4-hydroxy-tetrahydrodipicolinate synthase